MEGVHPWSGRRVAALAGACLACALASGAAVHAQQRAAPPADAAIPHPGTAHVLPMRPQARMLADGETCELIAGILTVDGELVKGGVDLYRGSNRRAFQQVSTREDGLIVAHFKAEPNEVVSGRAYWFDMQSQSMNHGPRTSTRCLSGSVNLGEPDGLSPEAGTR